MKLCDAIAPLRTEPQFGRCTIVAYLIAAHSKYPIIPQIAQTAMEASMRTAALRRLDHSLGARRLSEWV